MADMPDQVSQSSLSPDKDTPTEINVTANGPGAQAAQSIVNNYHIANTDNNGNFDDVYQNLKAMLKRRYQQIKMPKIPWIDNNWEFPLEHYYVDIIVTPKGDVKRGLIGKKIELCEIFSPVARQPPTRLLIEGPAGYGKSTLALKICYDSAAAKDYLSQYELVILLRLREFKNYTFEEILDQKLQLQGYESFTVFEAIKKHQKSTVIIFDGYDESDEKLRYSLEPLLKSYLLPDVTVVVTTRPGAISTMDDFNKKLEIKGVRGVNRCKFLRLHLQSCSDEIKAFLDDYLRNNFNISVHEKPTVVRSFRRLQRALSNVEEEEHLFDCPLFLLLVTAVARGSYPNTIIFKTKTDLYKKLLNFVGHRTLSERAGLEETEFFVFDVENPPRYIQSLNQFGKLAVKALIDKEFIFTREQVISQCDGDDIVLLMGLLTENESVDDIVGQHTSWLQPIHLSILEFCAAYHLWYSFRCRPTSYEFPSPFLPDLSGKVEYFVFPFLVGLCGNELDALLPTLDKEEIPDLIRHFARCESLLSESELDFDSVSKALLTLVPRVWHTSYFQYGNSQSVHLLKETVAEAVSRQLLECIVYDYDLDWDISKGNGYVRLPVVAIKTNVGFQSLKHSNGDIQCVEFRIFLESFKESVKDPLKSIHKMLTDVIRPSVISFVTTYADLEKLSSSLPGFDPAYNFFILITQTEKVPNKLKVVHSKFEDNNIVGKTVGLHEALPWLRQDNAEITELDESCEQLDTDSGDFTIIRKMVQL